MIIRILILFLLVILLVRLVRLGRRKIRATWRQQADPVLEKQRSEHFSPEVFVCECLDWARDVSADPHFPFRALRSISPDLSFAAGYFPCVAAAVSQKQYQLLVSH